MADSGGRVYKREETFSRHNRGTGNGQETKAVNRHSSQSKRDVTTSEYCEKLQEWMWQYYCGYVNWQSWMSVSAFSLPPCSPTPGLPTWRADLANGFSVSPTHVSTVSSRAGLAAPDSTPAQQPQQNGNAPQPGQEYSIPSPFQRFLAEMVDFFILFFIKATIILSIIHLSGMKDISKFAMHFIVEEIDEDTSMEELQKMMLVALVYRILVCFYEIVCIWGAGGATPGKFLIGLQVVTCDTSVLVQPNRVRVVPATNVSLSASTVRALNKNFSIAFFFPAFITLLFFQHNRTVYDIVAGTIVVKRNRPR
ncbi:protein FAM8A1b [Colossoma macropomum]|uniref:protein FAM8A1b n=1 Tax=Colossoma macropomum TaxID=42526 RepID=UPI001863EA32|nr:protein FAM8A1b [Colossoma macropomum]